MSRTYQGAGFAPSRGGHVARKQARVDASRQSLELAREKEKVENERDKQLREQQKKLEMIAEGMGMGKGRASASSTGELEGFITGQMQQAQMAAAEEKNAAAAQRLFANEQKQQMINERKRVVEMNRKVDRGIAFHKDALAGRQALEESGAFDVQGGADVKIESDRRVAKAQSFLGSPQARLRGAGADMDQKNIMEMQRIMAQGQAGSKYTGAPIQTEHPSGTTIVQAYEGGPISLIQPPEKPGADPTPDKKAWDQIIAAMQAGRTLEVESLGEKYFWDKAAMEMSELGKRIVPKLVTKAEEEDNFRTEVVPRHRGKLENDVHYLKRAKAALGNTKIATARDASADATGNTKVGDTIANNATAAEVKTAEEIIRAADILGIKVPRAIKSAPTGVPR